MPAELSQPAAVQPELLRAFASALPVAEGTEPGLGGALRQTLANPGSLVRAQLVYDMSLAFGLAPGSASRLAVAIEYFHTASVVFDDLPCMDDATRRRGAPCIHRSHGEAAAILAALALVSRAYALIWGALAGLDSETQLSAGACVEECLGVAGLLNGQSQDLHHACRVGPRPSPRRIAMGKTVSLIRLSLVLPALVGGAKTREIALLRRLAVFWGLGYQTIDDLKDVLLRPEQTGKNSARDALLNRPNVALDMGTPRALQSLDRLIHLGDSALDRLLQSLPSLAFLTRLGDRLRDEACRLRVAGLSHS